MKELFYFSKSDLMIQVQYSHQSNALRYASHRRITEVERLIIEKYINDNIITGTDSDKYRDASLDYMGIDYKLISSLHQYHAIKPFKDSELATKESDKNPFENLINKDIDQSVKNLINKSMENYYFEQIGNVILEIRKCSESKGEQKKIEEMKNNLKELVGAYNQYTRKKVEFKEILPGELAAHF